MRELWNEILKIKSGPKELRGFAWVMAVALAVIAGFLWWRHGAALPALLVVAALFALPALADTLIGSSLCVMLLPLHKVWMALALVLGHVMAHVVLAVLFFGVVTPMGVAARLLGKPLVDRSWNPGSVQSHWIARDPAAQDKKQCEKQY